MANGLMQSMAASGRNGDTMVAHLTPGEMIIPKEVAALRPDLVAHVQDGIRRMGGDASKYVAGRGRVNPATGAEEFATEAEITAAYQNVLGRAPDAAGLQNWMAQPSMSADDINKAFTASTENINNIYQNTFGRPAEQGGVDYWSNQAASIGSNDALKSAIRSGAQNDDVVARDDIAKDAIDPRSTWSNGASLDSPNLKYDAANNTWGVIPKTPTAAQAAQTGLMAIPQATASGYTPTLSNINAPTDTVQGQIDAIIAKNSPLMQRAESRANEQMNARGLLNSSMAVGAGQAALIDAAAPIAAADANAYNATRFNNQNASNTGSQFNANAQNQVALANMDTAAKMTVADAQIKSDISKFNASQSNDLIKLGMDRDTRTGLANIEATYKNQLQSSASASDMYKQALTTYASILTNKDMTPEAKTTAMNDIVTSLNDGLRVLKKISGLDLGSMLNFSNPAAPAATDPAATTNATGRAEGGGGDGGSGGGSGE